MTLKHLGYMLAGAVILIAGTACSVLGLNQPAPPPVPASPTPASSGQEVVSFEPPTGVSLPSEAGVGDQIDVIITVTNPGFNQPGAKLGDNFFVSAQATGPLNLLPETFNPQPISPNPKFLTWQIPTRNIPENASFVIQGRGRVTGVQRYDVVARTDAEIIRAASSTGSATGQGRGRGVTSTLSDTSDSITVGESFAYQINIIGQAFPLPFEVVLELPSQVTPESILAVHGTNQLDICSVDNANHRIVCREYEIGNGEELEIVVNVRADQPGNEEDDFTVKAKMEVLLNTSSSGRLSTIAEEITWIYPRN